MLNCDKSVSGIYSVRITKMLMRGPGSRAKRAKKFFPGPSWEGPGKVISWLLGCDEQCEVFHAVYSQFDKIIC